MILYQNYWYVKYFTIIFGNIAFMKEIRFAENLKRLRKAKNLTQAELAGMLGVDQRTVSAWENSVAEPCLNMLAKLTEIFDESFDSLIGD